MIHFTEPRIVQAYLDQRVESALHGAEAESLLRQARVYQPGKLSWRHRILQLAGRGFIGVGRRLELYGHPPSICLDEQLCGRHSAHP